MTPSRSSTRLLIRATVLDDRVVAFADALAAASDCPVAFVVDERHGPVDGRGRTSIGLSESACAGLGLHCPPDFAWKCGDYGYYLARRAFPETRWFWMIEYDVRFEGGDLREFFDFFAERPADFIAPFLVPAAPDWFWARTVHARDTRAWQCLFPVTRLSARAIDIALAKRVQHSQNPFRRLIWPNDEAFVATTLVAAGLDCHDFNGFGREFYSPQSFSFTAPIDGDAFCPPSGRLQIFHPVLFGDAYARKVAKLKEPVLPMRTSSMLIRKVGSRVNLLSRW